MRSAPRTTERVERAAMGTGAACPACGRDAWKPFYRVEEVPVQSCRQMPDRTTALAQPRGRLDLALCRECGFAANTAFRPELLDYAADYESTQAESATFQAYARRLAAEWIERYDLHDRRIIEIGCGGGEFLALICAMGNNRGIGFDPACAGGRAAAGGRIELRAEPYGAAQHDVAADFICCRHTLEHIGPVADFLVTLRHNLEGRANVVVAFEVPDLERILTEGAFWDLYYEHCSYFTLLSLETLFRRCGFDVLRIERVYDDQYLVLEARPGGRGAPDDRGEELAGLADAAEDFAHRANRQIDRWRDEIRAWRRKGRPVALWGSGSKAVGFMATLGIGDDIAAVVDINPAKHGKYMPGCAAPIVAPDRLRALAPGVVIVMNPVYRDEIARELARLKIHPELKVLQ